MVQTEVTYAPSPRRIGKKKVKLNPVIRKSGGSNCSLGANSPSQNYDKQPPALPVLLPNESEKKNAVVIGGKTKLLRESYIAFIVFDILAPKFPDVFKNFQQKWECSIFLDSRTLRWKTQN